MKSNSQFKTMRHIETVRNYIQAFVKELLNRGAKHDQSKMEEPELSIFNEYTPRLKGLTYGSEEYKKCLQEMLPAVRHHQTANRHHPEYFENGIAGMNLIDMIEMLADWKAATLRHADGDIYKSLEINAKRFGYSPEIYTLFKNTINWLEIQEVAHHADES